MAQKVNPAPAVRGSTTRKWRAGEVRIKHHFETQHTLEWKEQDTPMGHLRAGKMCLFTFPMLMGDKPKEELELTEAHAQREHEAAAKTARQAYESAVAALAANEP